MGSKQRILAAVGIGCAALVACAPTADVPFVQPEGPLVRHTDARQCAPVVERQVDALGLSGRAASISYHEQLQNRDRSGDRPEFLRGFNAWVDLSDCQGYLVIDMRPTCSIRQIYVTDSCPLPASAMAGSAP